MISSFSNGFGEVQPDRIVFNVRKSLFGGAVREDLPVRHITSVRHETQRRPILGFVLGLIGIAFLISGGDSGVLIGLFFIALAVVLLAGTPAVTINTSGGDRRKSLGRPFQGAEAASYATAVREAVFAKTE